MKSEDAFELVGKCLLINFNGKKILAVGDLHLGYEEALVSSGVMVGKKLYGEMIEYFDKVFERTGKVEEIILLGDVKHVFGDILRGDWNDVLGLFDYFEGKMEKEGKMVIVKGNHDAILEPIVKKRKNVLISDYYIEGGWAFMHGDRDYEEIHSKEIKYWVMGHGHPAVKMSDGVKMEKYKCFLVGDYGGKRVIIVPSFISANEGSDPREDNWSMGWGFNLREFGVWIVSEDLEVLDFGKLKKLR